MDRSAFALMAGIDGQRPVSIVRRGLKSPGGSPANSLGFLRSYLAGLRPGAPPGWALASGMDDG